MVSRAAGWLGGGDEVGEVADAQGLGVEYVIGRDEGDGENFGG